MNVKSERKGGFPEWTPDDLDKFERRHPIGSKARLALSLLAFTGAGDRTWCDLARPWCATAS